MRFAGALLLAVFHAGAAMAQPAELARLNCWHLLDLPGPESERLIVWLHGYYAGAAQRPTLEGRQFETAMETIRQACGRDRALALVGAEARGIFLGIAPPAAASPAPGPRSVGSPEQRRPVPLPSR
jgi:HdeA/HdeB family